MKTFCHLKTFYRALSDVKYAVGKSSITGRSHGGLLSPKTRWNDFLPWKTLEDDLKVFCTKRPSVTQRPFTGRLLPLKDALRKFSITGRSFKGLLSPSTFWNTSIFWMTLGHHLKVILSRHHFEDLLSLRDLLKVSFTPEGALLSLEDLLKDFCLPRPFGMTSHLGRS